jgi:hypothetical protein
MQFGVILAGRRTGRRKEQGKPLIERLSRFGIAQGCEMRRARGRQAARQIDKEIAHGRAGDAHHGDRRAARARAERENRLHAHDAPKSALGSGRRAELPSSRWR